MKQLKLHLRINHLKPQLLLLALIIYGGSLFAQIAFPTAEGYGKNTVGGRGGAVYEVTNLNDSGTGSLRAAVEASGSRTVVFRVSGTINLTKNLTISNPNITIAGQTAPGDGICIKKYTFNINADQVIIRYIRIRYGDELKNDADAVSMRGKKNIILDHVSASWGDDETMSLYFGENVTIQWCMITETLNRGGSHGFAGIWGSNYSTYHHNLIAHCTSRAIRWASGSGNNDYRNNVIYNWDYQSCYGGEKVQPDDAAHTFFKVNMVNNYYKPGPATDSEVRDRIAQPSARSTSDKGDWYVSGNYMMGSTTVTNDNWQGIDGTNFNKLSSAWSAMAINQQTAPDAYTSVLDKVGCSLKRDAVDTRIINEVRNGTATYGSSGIIESQSTVGGWPTLSSTAAPTDSDHDGMPDSWEDSKGLNKTDASDRNSKTLDGSYTNLEVYLNSLVDGSTPTVSVTGVTVTPASASISVGGTTQLTASIAPSNATNKTVTWTSSSTSIATVNSSGLVAGIASGNATITVTTQDGNKTATSAITVSVTNVPVTSVSVSPISATINVGATTQLTATVAPSNATNKTVTWSSSSTSIATVSSSGLVTGVAAGSATITVKTSDGSKTATCAITVATSSSPTPIIKLGFNENTGTSFSNKGSVSATFTKTSIPAWSTNVPTNGGASSVDFGTTTGNYYVESSSVISQLAGLTSFTITGWVNCRNSTVGSGGNRIVSWINNGGNGVDLVYLADGSLKLGINQWPDASTAVSSAAKITTNSSAIATNWKFFAVTYSGTTVQYYFGANSTSAVLDKSLSYNKGSVGTSIGKMAIGHFNVESSRSTRTDRMFKGLIDQIEVYNSVLTLSQIQNIQNTSGLKRASINNDKAAVLKNEFVLFPNPVINNINITGNLEETGNVSIHIYDILGHSVSKQNMGVSEKGSLNLNIPVDNLPAGIYTLWIKTDNALKTIQFVKK